MIAFYPIDNGLWGDDFDFHQTITLTPKAKTNHKTFPSRNDLAAYIHEKVGHPALAAVELTGANDGTNQFNVTLNGTFVGVATDDYK